MSEHLAIGLGAKGDAAGLEPCPQRGGILDDAVMDDRDAVRSIAMRMGVAVAGLAMGRPTGMSQTGRALEALRQQFLELANPPFALGELELARAGYRDACRIVAAIFEPVQPFHQDRRRVAFRRRNRQFRTWLRSPQS